jgi:hypothetical protein
MEFPLQIAVGPTPAFLSFLPDKLLFLGALEPVQVTPSRRPFRVASAQTVAGVPAPVKSRASGDTVSMSDFLFILVDLTEYIVDFLCAPVGSGQPTRSVYPLILLDSP